MKYEEKSCKGEGCGSHYIINKHFWLCDRCNQTRLSLNKRSKKPFIVIKKKKSTYVYKRKTTGERALFLEIWEERQDENGNRFCKFCGELLEQEPHTYNFSHRKAKSLDESGRLKKKNIDLTCFECHFEHEFVGKKNRKKNI